MLLLASIGCSHGHACFTLPFSDVGAVSTSGMLEMSASMQEHCVAALLRVHKKQIMRLRSPEDFIQVQP